MSSNSSIPGEVLEQRAAEQRRRLHNSVSELRSSVTETVKDRLDAKKYLREYTGPATAIAAVVGLLMGYSVTGMFTRH